MSFLQDDGPLTGHQLPSTEEAEAGRSREPRLQD
jgi:hypothetical protein